MGLVLYGSPLACSCGPEDYDARTLWICSPCLWWHQHASVWWSLVYIEHEHRNRGWGPQRGVFKNIGMAPPIRSTISFSSTGKMYVTTGNDPRIASKSAPISNFSGGLDWPPFPLAETSRAAYARFNQSCRFVPLPINWWLRHACWQIESVHGSSNCYQTGCILVTYQHSNINILVSLITR